MPKNKVFFAVAHLCGLLLLKKNIIFAIEKKTNLLIKKIGD